MPVPDIAQKLTIKTGRNVGSPPSVASLYSAFAEAQARQPGEPETPEQAALHQRLTDQVLQLRADE